MYQLSARSIKREIKSAYNVSLLNTRERIDAYFRNINQLTLQFEMVPEVEQLTRGSKEDVDIVTLLKLMTRLHASLDHVDNIMVYNPRNGQLLSTNGANNGLYDNYKPIIDAFAGMNAPEAFITMPIHELSTSVFVRKLPVFSEVQTIYMLFHINRSLFDTMIGMNKYNQSGSYFIFDGLGKLVANRGLFDDETVAPWIERIRSESQTVEGDTSAVINTKNTFITYLAPSYNGWSYAFAIGNRSFLNNALELRDVTLRISLLLFAAAIVLAFVSSHWLWRGWNRLKSLLDNKMAAPEMKVPHNEFDFYLTKVQSILNQSQYLKKQSDEMLPQLREAICLSFLENGAGAPEALHKIRQYAIPIKEGAFCCFCVAIDFPREAEAVFSAEDVAALEYAVASVVKEVVDEHAHGFAVRTPKGRAAAVISREDGNFVLLGETVRQATDKISSFIKQYFPITVSIGIGKMRSDIRHLNVSYSEALEMLDRTLISGGNRVYDAGEANEEPQESEFPYRELENDIVYGIRTRNREYAYAALEQLYELKERDPISYKRFQSKMIELVQSVFHQIRDRYEELDMSEPTIDELLRLAGLDNWVDWMKRECIDRCIEQLDQMHRANVSSVAARIEDYVAKHVESDIQIEACCKSLNIPVSFARQALKDEYGITFNDLIVRARVEQAKRWFETERYSVEEVARRLQYSNAQNFSRMFKKEVGVPPGQYRASAR